MKVRDCYVRTEIDSQKINILSGVACCLPHQNFYPAIFRSIRFTV